MLPREPAAKIKFGIGPDSPDTLPSPASSVSSLLRSIGETEMSRGRVGVSLLRSCSGVGELTASSIETGETGNGQVGSLLSSLGVKYSAGVSRLGEYSLGTGL